MGRLSNKNVLFIISKQNYNEEELVPLLEIFKREDATIKVASEKFSEARGMNSGRIMPDLMIVDAIEGITGDSYVADAKGTRQIKGIFHGTVVIGGKGAKKYLWNDKLVRLLLNDRYRSGFVISAIGTGTVCMGKTGLMESHEVAADPNDEKLAQALEELQTFVVDEEIKVYDRMITAKGASAVEPFAEAVIQAIEKTPHK